MADIINSGNKKDKWTKKVTDWINWLNEKKQATLVAGDNVTLTPQQDGTVQIDAGGGAVALDDLTDVDVSSVTDGQALVYDELNEKWIAGEAGQGDDVVMNGNSIVTNKVASFKNYKEITRSQYDALPDTKYSDGILYCITDSGVKREGTYSPVIYSLAEREIGVYLDGKPLYQKTLVATSTDITGTDVNIDVASLNIDTCVDITGTFDRIKGGGNKRIYMFNAYESSEYWSFVRYQDTEQRVTFKIAMAIGQGTTKQTITIRYTKTTDNAGAGSWTTDGVPAHHYSTSEKVIGTWLDGKTLYEKTYQGSEQSSTNPKIVDANIKSDSGIYRVVDIQGIWAIGDWTYSTTTIQELNTQGTFSSGSNTAYCRVTPSGLCFYRNNANYGACYRITIRYTKTS